MTTGLKKGALWVVSNVIAAAGISYNPVLNLDEWLNADWKYAIGSTAVRTKAKLEYAANDHMTTLEQNPQCTCSYFQDPRVTYAA